MAVAARMIRGSADTDRRGRPLGDAGDVCEEHGCELPDDVIVAPRRAGRRGPRARPRPARRGEPVVVDIWPRDRASRCWADMTRTFVAGGGEPGEELARYWRLTRESLERIYPMVRAGADCRALFRGAPASRSSRRACRRS